MVENTAPTRQQLERIAQGDYRLLTALERLFEQSENSGDFDEIAALFAQTALASFSSSANNTSNDALAAAFLSGAMGIAKQALEIALQAEAKANAIGHKPANENFPVIRRVTPESVYALNDVDLSGLADGDLWQWDATSEKWIPITGATGSFTAGSGEAITVTNGVITSIV